MYVSVVNITFVFVNIIISRLIDIKKNCNKTSSPCALVYLFVELKIYVIVIGNHKAKNIWPN